MLSWPFILATFYFSLSTQSKILNNNNIQLSLCLVMVQKITLQANVNERGRWRNENWRYNVTCGCSARGVFCPEIVFPVPCHPPSCSAAWIFRLVPFPVRSKRFAFRFSAISSFTALFSFYWSKITVNLKSGRSSTLLIYKSMYILPQKAHV